MSKKTFAGGLASVLRRTEPRRVKQEQEAVLHPGAKRAEATLPLRVDKALLPRLRGLAFREGKTIRDLVDGILRDYLDKYEAKSGKIQLPGG